jgi:Heparinase II/III-like protein
LTNGPVGTEGFGNHKHCDQLAIEVCLDRQPVFVDAGSYVYTSDPAERNRFRGTATHNTVMIDGEEQHRLNPAWLFRLFQEGEAAAIDGGCAGGALSARSAHSAYARLTPPVTHARRVTLEADGTVAIEDRFDGLAGHRFRWHFLLHPSVRPQRSGTAVRLDWPGGAATFEGPSSLVFEIVDSWYSPSYGVRQPTSALVAESNHVLEETLLKLRPARPSP